MVCLLYSHSQHQKKEAVMDACRENGNGYDGTSPDYVKMKLHMQCLKVRLRSEIVN